MGACATKPKASKDEENAPVTRELEPEATEKLIDAEQTETSATGGGEKDELATKQVEAKEQEPPAGEAAMESAIEEAGRAPTAVDTKDAEQANEEVKPEAAAAVPISLTEKSIEVLEQVKTEQAAEVAEQEEPNQVHKSTV